MVAPVPFPHSTMFWPHLAKIVVQRVRLLVAALAPGGPRLFCMLRTPLLMPGACPYFLDAFDRFTTAWLARP